MNCSVEKGPDERLEAERFAEAVMIVMQLVSKSWKVHQWRESAGFWSSRECGGSDYRLPARQVEVATEAHREEGYWCCYYCMKIHRVEAERKYIGISALARTHSPSCSEIKNRSVAMHV